MSKGLLTCILLFITHLAIGQEKVIYDANAEKRNLEGFHSVHVSHGIDLFITQSAAEGVAVSAAQTDQRNMIKAEVENGVLKIYFNNENIGWNWRGSHLKAYIAVTTLREIKAAGGSDVMIYGLLNTTDLSLKLSDGSDFNGSVSVTNLTVHQSGGSDVRISGKAVNVRVKARGTSDFNGYDLTAEYAIIKTGSGSDAGLTVTRELAAEASGGSDVNYKGNPVIRYKSSSGGSSVTKRD